MTRQIKARIWLLAAATVLPPLAAQRLDGCFENHHSHVADVVRDRALMGAGYSLTERSLVPALSNPDPSIRSLAAMKLASLGGKGSMATLMRMWSIEPDPCTKGAVSNALEQLLWGHWVLKPQNTRRIVPFQACTPSSPALVSLRLEQLTPRPRWTYRGPTVQLTVRNLTSEALPFLGYVDLAALFSVTVLDPTGHPAKIPAGQACYYKECDPKSDPTISALCTSGCFPMFLPAAPAGGRNVDLEGGSGFRHVGSRRLYSKPRGKTGFSRHNRMLQQCVREGAVTAGLRDDFYSHASPQSGAVALLTARAWSRRCPAESSLLIALAVGVGRPTNRTTVAKPARPISGFSLYKLAGGERFSIAVSGIVKQRPTYEQLTAQEATA